VTGGGTQNVFEFGQEDTFVEEEGNLPPRIVEATDPHWGRSIGTSNFHHAIAPLFELRHVKGVEN
jgi:hypothetical protein